MKKKPYYDNRELSWLKFNERVLNEAGNASVPLCERLTFASIYQSNLDEFYMVRVGSLHDQMEVSDDIRDNKTNMTSEEQIDAILEQTRKLDAKKEKIYEQIMGELEPKGIRIINFNKLSEEEGKLLEAYYDSEIAPLLSPMIVGKAQPFPFLKNKDIYAVIVLKTKTGKDKLAIIPCSNGVFKRLIEIPTRPGNFMLSEELILHFVGKIFDKYSIQAKTLMRMTRNADIDADAMYDEDLNYRDLMSELIKQRKKLCPVRLELSRDINEKSVKALCKYLNLSKKQVFFSKVPLDLSFVFQIQDYLRADESLFYPKRTPQRTKSLDYARSILDQVEEKDVLLSYPYESIKPFLNMLHEAANDASVVSIKMTLYRVAKQSKVVEALIEAAENGKEVVVLVELRARFDEENNIEWSRRLEDAGCRVIYGLTGYKVHSKLCLITRKDEKGVRFLTQIGTGNYNEKTARMHTDLSLLTANQSIGAEAALVFQSLLFGETVENTEYLLVAPNSLQNKVVNMIQEEIDHAIAGEEAYIGIKINSLTDKVIIDKLIEASKAGVKIEMIVRGICCLVPGVEGETDNITVISIVGRFLEHSRIYRFGVGEREKMYIASADFMTRNTIRRVEVAAPIYEEDIKNRLRRMFELMLSDDEKGKQLRSEGIYGDRHVNEAPVNSQERFYAMAYGEEV